LHFDATKLNVFFVVMEQKKLLFIGLVWPEPKSSAAGTRSLQLLTLFQEKGYAITVASAAQNLEFSEPQTDSGFSFHPIAINDPAFDSWVNELQPDVVLFDRFITEEQFGWRVRENCPNALTLLDTIDVHFLRIARQEAVKKNLSMTRNLMLSDTAKRELASYYRCDWVLVISKFEYEWLQNEWHFPPSQLLYLPLFGEKATVIVPYEVRADFVFIGNFMHEPNWDAVKILKQEIWPNIRKQLPQAQLHIYGAYATDKVTQLHHPQSGFLIKGRAEEALAVLSNAKVLLAPLRFGAGIKGKLLEAMQVGTPSVTTSIGAEGMHHNELWNGVIADDWSEFANQAVQLYTNQEVWNQAQQNGFTLLEIEFSKEKTVPDFWGPWEASLASLQQRRSENIIGQLLQHHTLQSTRYLAKWIEAKNGK
jgi:glycosyltransferase involved in cell wall biosynthesis